MRPGAGACLHRRRARRDRRRARRAATATSRRSVPRPGCGRRNGARSSAATSTAPGGPCASSRRTSRAASSPAPRPGPACARLRCPASHSPRSTQFRRGSTRRSCSRRPKAGRSTSTSQPRSEAAPARDNGGPPFRLIMVTQWSPQKPKSVYTDPPVRLYPQIKRLPPDVLRFGPCLIRCTECTPVPCGSGLGKPFGSELGELAEQDAAERPGRLVGQIDSRSALAAACRRSLTSASSRAAISIRSCCASERSCWRSARFCSLSARSLLSLSRSSIAATVRVRSATCAAMLAMSSSEVTPAGVYAENLAVSTRPPSRTSGLRARRHRTTRGCSSGVRREGLVAPHDYTQTRAQVSVEQWWSGWRQDAGRPEAREDCQHVDHHDPEPDGSGAHGPEGRKRFGRMRRSERSTALPPVFIGEEQFSDSASSAGARSRAAKTAVFSSRVIATIWAGTAQPVQACAAQVGPRSPRARAHADHRPKPLRSSCRSSLQ